MRDTGTRVARFIVCVCAMMICAHAAFGQDDNDPPAELVIEDFGTTGLGDDSSFLIAFGGAFRDTSTIDLGFDFFISPLFAIRVSINTLLSNVSTADTRNIAFDAGLGTVWRSYVINRIRFYGGLMVRVGIAPFTDVDLLLIPEGFGGFEFYVGSAISMYIEFGGRSAIPIASLDCGCPSADTDYASGFFFKIGTRFEF